MWVLTLIVLAVSVDRAGRSLDERAVPLMGVTAAFIFAAQMVNFPVAGGTSGHLLGGVLAAVLLGPWAGTLVMACVVTSRRSSSRTAASSCSAPTSSTWVSSARSADTPSMPPSAGSSAGRSGPCCRPPPIAAWVAVMLGALAMTLELAVSGTSPLELALPAMLGVHALIGIGEALITVSGAGLHPLRPPRPADAARRSTQRWRCRHPRRGMAGAPGGLAVRRRCWIAWAGHRRARRAAAGAAGIAAPGRPRARRGGPRLPGPGPGRAVLDPAGLHRARLDDPVVTTIVAGLIGLVIVFLAMWGLGAVLTRRRQTTDNERS